METSGFKVESGIQLLSRLLKKPEVNTFYPVLFSCSPNFGDVIEISNDELVTSLLADIICEVLLPTELGGSGIGVLIVNTDGNLHLDLIIEVLQKKVSLRDSCYSKNIQEYLKNLYLLEIYDSSQMYATIQELESILLEHHIIGLIVINTITAFYWSEQGFKITKMDNYIKQLLNKIKNVTKAYKPILIYTKPDWFCSNKGQVDIKKYCPENSANGVHYSIQLSTHKNYFKANVVSQNMCLYKHFVILDNTIKWL